MLLLGVGFNRCTALHYAESLVDNRRTTTVRFPVLANGERVWREVQNVADDNDRHFPKIGDEFISTGSVRRGRIGRADATLFAMRCLVKCAVEYFGKEF